MKKIFISDLLKDEPGLTIVELFGWLKYRRVHGEVVFLDIVDSTGTIQAVASKKDLPEKPFELSKKIPLESAVKITGQLLILEKNSGKEILLNNFEVISQAVKQISPRPRSTIEIFDPRVTEQILNLRHLYLRNEKVMAILRYRHVLMGLTHQWFRQNRFTEICAPVLTALPLYDDRSAISLRLHDEEVFLTQCVGFYLESAVHGFERVYNIGPSFRGEESRSRRHLMEYWHIKAELAFGNLEDIISLVEDFVCFLIEQSNEVCGEIYQILSTKPFTLERNPFPRLSYREALTWLKKEGLEAEFGKSLGSEEEEVLSRQFVNTPFWITGIPRTIEPFPYVIDENDKEVTKTADLIAHHGYGELLGVAEKIHDLAMLDERLGEKGKQGDQRYEWLRELRQTGCVPHIGFGMGVERFIRWALHIPHVRDAMPFPRIFRRRIFP